MPNPDRQKGAGNFNKAYADFVDEVSEAVAGEKVFSVQVNVVAFVTQTVIRCLRDKSDLQRKEILRRKEQPRKEGIETYSVDKNIMDYVLNFGEQIQWDREKNA